MPISLALDHHTISGVFHTRIRYSSEAPMPINSPMNRGLEHHIYLTRDAEHWGVGAVIIIANPLKYGPHLQMCSALCLLLLPGYRQVTHLSTVFGPSLGIPCTIILTTRISGRDVHLRRDIGRRICAGDRSYLPTFWVVIPPHNQLLSWRCVGWFDLVCIGKCSTRVHQYCIWQNWRCSLFSTYEKISALTLEQTVHWYISLLNAALPFSLTREIAGLPILNMLAVLHYNTSVYS